MCAERRSSRFTVKKKVLREPNGGYNPGRWE